MPADRPPAMFVAALAAALALAACGGSTLPAEREARAVPAPDPEWLVTASVSSEEIGALEVAVGPVDPAPLGDAEPWLQHDVTLTNAGDEPLRLADTRTSTFVGKGENRMLLVADAGCGYTAGTQARAGACALYLDAPLLEPDESVTRTLTLFKDLRGMSAIEPGTYALDRTIRYAPGLEIPAEGAGRTALVTIRYHVARR